MTETVCSSSPAALSTTTWSSINPVRIANKVTPQNLAIQVTVTPLWIFHYTYSMEAWFFSIGGTFAALLPITNPFSTAPVFVTVTRGFSDARRNQQARLASIYMVCVLLGALFTGALVLEFFGISVPIMRVAGGLIIVRIGFGMVSPEPEQQVSEENKQEAVGMADVAFTPIAMPLLSGPGSIAVTISMATTVTGAIDYVAIAIGICMVAVICWIVLRSSAFIVDRMSATGMNVLTRLMGFLLICIGIQFVATGIFEGLTNPDVVGPILEAWRRPGP
jgi:multiple antibiotic resistance protein